MGNLKKYLGFLFFLVVFLFGLFFGVWFVDSNYEKCANRFSFINPVFACLEKITINKKAYLDLKLNLMSYIEIEKKEGRASEIGLFFRDLEAGPTLGINDRIDFIPASLLKLPHILAILRFSEEENPNILSQKLMYDNENLFVNNQEFPPKEIIKVNTSYTIDELVERVLEYSDNLADELIVKHLKALGGERDLVAEIYRDLGIVNSYNLNSTSIGVKGYNSIFRLLYNSSFLNKDNSEKLLKILSQNTFEEGLRAGIPRDIKLANKFGERTLSSGEKQLHDCGIVYYPTNPYSLCVMTKGEDFKDLEKIISHISEEVFKEFDSRKLEK